MFSSLSFVALAIALVVPTAVNAHGFVHELQIDGKSYSGYLPFTDPYESPAPERIVRKIPDDGPVLDVSNSDIACNKGGQSGAGAVATAAAGSKITFDWQNWPSDHQGPVSTYMTSCNGDCTKFDASNAKWFKVDAAGYSNGKWAATQLIENGFKWTSTIPADLNAGEYLVRHEIVALHSVGQPQFYPSCAQVKVIGGGSKVPTAAELVGIPGLYANTKWPDIWDNNFKSFAIPGPKAFAGSDSSSGNDGPAPAPASTTTKAITTESPTTTRVHETTKAATKSTHVNTTAPTTAAGAESTSAVPSAPASTGRCKSKRRRGMVKRHVSHLAKRHH